MDRTSLEFVKMTEFEMKINKTTQKITVIFTIRVKNRQNFPKLDKMIRNHVLNRQILPKINRNYYNYN
jgi:hypothetical protein